MSRSLMVFSILAAFSLLAFDAATGRMSAAMGEAWPMPARFLVDGMLLPAFGRMGSAGILAAVAILGALAASAGGLRTPSPALAASSPAPLTAADRKLVAGLIGGMVAQVKHEQGMVEARSASRDWVKLVPQVPIRDRQPATFFGGEPLMPAGEAWPQGASGPAFFLGQVDCRALPRDLWNGLGPREGSLAFFLDAKTYAPQVRHFTGPLVRREEAQTGLPDWNSPAAGRHNGLEGYFADTMPHWAFDVVAMNGPQDDEESRASRDDGPRTARYRNGFDIRNSPWRPFDAVTLRMIPDAIASDLVVLGRIRTDGEKRARQRLARYEETAATLDAAQRQGWEDTKRELVGYAACQQALEGLKHELAALAREFAAADDEAAIDAGLARIETLAVPQMRRGSEELQYEPVSLVAEPGRGGWQLQYVGLFEDWAKRLHAREPEALPPEAAAELVKFWEYGKAGDAAYLGHIPFGYVHEFDEATEVTLLELQSSNLMNWIWSDVNTLVLTMTKADLAAGRFDLVRMQVSN